MATILQFIGPFFVIGYLTVTHKQVMRRLDIIAAILAFGGVFLLSTHGKMWTAAVIIIGTIIPFQLMENALRYVKPATVSLLDAFEALSATIGSVLVFGLSMAGMDWVGSILVVLAVMVLNIVPSKK